MTTRTHIFRPTGPLPLVIIALSLTNVFVAQIYDFRLAVFWPVLLLAIVINSSVGARLRVPRSAGAFLLAIVLMILSWTINLSAISPTSVAFSLGWMVYWYFLTVAWGPRLAPDLQRALTVVAQIYFFAIFVSVLLTLLGWRESPFPNLLGWVLDVRSEQPRFFGPTSEPSYAALILGATALGILRIRIGLGLTARSRSSDFALLGIFLSLFLLNSIYGYAVVFLLLSAIASTVTKRFAARFLFVLALVPLLPLVITLIPADSRLGQLLALSSQLNFVVLQSVDNSAFMRFGPTLEMFEHVSPRQVEFWIGHGAGTAEVFFGNLFSHVLDAGETSINLGFLPAFLFDYGFLACLAILFYLFSIANGPFSAYTRFLFLISLLNCNFNTNMFWFLVTVAFASSPQAIDLHRRHMRRKGAMSNPSISIESASQL